MLIDKYFSIFLFVAVNIIIKQLNSKNKNMIACEIEDLINNQIDYQVHKKLEEHLSLSCGIDGQDQYASEVQTGIWLMKMIVEQSEKHEHQKNQIKAMYEQNLGQLRNKVDILEKDADKKNKEYCIQVKRYLKELEKRQEDIKDLQKTVKQLRTKVSSYQQKIQKYEFQLNTRDQDIKQIWATLHEALITSEQFTIDQYRQAIEKQIDELDIEGIDGPRAAIKKQNVISQYMEICKTMADIYQQIQSCKVNKDDNMVNFIADDLDKNARQNLKTIIDILDEPEENIDVDKIDNSQTYNMQNILTIYQSNYDNVIQYAKNLFSELQFERESHKTFSLKYAQFLKQSEQKLSDLRKKNQQLCQKLSQFQMQEQKTIQQSIQREKTISNLSNKMKSMNEDYIKKQAGLTQKINSLTQALKQKDQQINTIEKQKQQESKETHKKIETLTIQIQSLREAISTVKNVIRNNKEEKVTEPLDTVIVQQMIDKTYEIRLNNSQMKEELEAYKMREQQNQLLYEETEKKLCQKIDQCQRYQRQYEDKCKLVSQKESQLKNYEQEIIRFIQQSSQYIFQIELLSNQISGLRILLNNKTKQERNLQMNFSNIELNLPSFRQNNDQIQNKSNKRKSVGQLVSVSQRKSANNSINNSISRVCLQTQTKQHHNSPINKQNNVQAWNPNVCETLEKLQSNSQSIISSSVLNQNSNNLNKTCKIQNSRKIQEQQTIMQQNLMKKYAKSIQNMNDMINYMINVLKGYTRNGIRKHCWIMSQGNDHVLKMQNSVNIRQKYGNFQRIRQLCEQDNSCRRLIKDFDKISAYYFGKLEENYEFQTSSLINVSNTTINRAIQSIQLR